MIKAVIYDLDDLMVNSHGLHVEASEKVFQKFGVSQEKLPENIKAGFIGMRVSEILKELIKIYKLKINYQKVYKEREKVFLDLVMEKLEPMPGLFQSLEIISKSGYKIAIASSGTKKYIDMVLNKFKIANYFDVIITGDDVKSGKPNPETYQVAVKKLRVKPQETIVLEDATKGIIAAKSAGCVCIAVKNPYTPKQNLSKADIKLNSLNNLNIGLIKSL